MHVDYIKDYEDFARLQSNWMALYRLDPDAQLFLSWPWLDQIFSQKSSGWCVIAIREHAQSDQYLAFFPLRIQPRLNKDRSAFCDEVSMAGSFFWADYTGFLCHPDHEHIALPQLAKALKQLDWNRLFLKHLRCSKRRRDLFLAEFPEQDFYLERRQHDSDGDGGRIDKLICPWIPLPESFDDYLSSRPSSNTRQKIRRFLRKTDQHNSCHITISSAATLERDLEIFTTFWRQKWQSSKGRKTNQLAEKYQQILRSASDAGLLFMPVLWKDDKPAGVLGHFVDFEKKQLLFFVAGRDSKDNNPPAGLLLHAFSIRWAIEQNFKCYDFLRGNESYKYSFGCEQRHIDFIVIGTRDGLNLNGRLDPHGIDRVLRLSDDYADRGRLDIASTGYRQILDQDPEHRLAAQRINALPTGHDDSSVGGP